MKLENKLTSSNVNLCGYNDENEDMKLKHELLLRNNKNYKIQVNKENDASNKETKEIDVR